MLFLKVKGPDIVDERGRKVMLRGFCAGGFMNMENFINGYPAQEHEVRAALAEVLGPGKAAFFFDRMLDHFLDEDDIRFMAGLGATSLRLPFNYRHFEDDARPFHYKPEGFKRLDSILAACRKHGLYLIPDLHSAQGFQNIDWHCDNPTHVAFLWTQRQFQDRVVALWETLAERYRGEPAIAGYNILNEPVCLVKGALPSFYRRIAKAVRRIDRRHILFLEGNWFSSDFAEMEADLDPNTVYSSHNYMAPNFSHGPYPGRHEGVLWDKARMKKRVEHVTSFMRRRRQPVWAGEFGSLFRGGRHDTDRLRAVDDQCALFNSMGFHWSIWTYKDIGVMGTAVVRPDSEWMERTARVRRLKEKLGPDVWGQADSIALRATRTITNGARRLLGPKALEEGRMSFYASRMISGLLLSGLLVKPFARTFRGMTEGRIDRMMGSFDLKNCAVRAGLASTLKMRFQEPTIS